MKCFACTKRIFFWEARFTITDDAFPSAEISFHGECACEWLLQSLNGFLRDVTFRRVLGWMK